MTHIDFKKLLEQSLEKYGGLKIRRDQLDAEMMKQMEFIRALVHMLSDEDRKEFKDRINEAFENSQIKEAGLTESIRLVLQRARDQFLTATQVRDHLVQSGFDFSEYSSNPLASVSTTLRRLKPEEVEAIEVRGVAAYKWIGWVKMNENPAPKSLTHDGMAKAPWKPMKK
jgi:hypothetical protein